MSQHAHAQTHDTLVIHFDYSLELLLDGKKETRIPKNYKTKRKDRQKMLSILHIKRSCEAF